MGFKKISPKTSRGPTSIVGATMSTTCGAARLCLFMAAYRQLGEPERVDVLLGTDEHAGAFALVPAKDGARKVSVTAGVTPVVSLGGIVNKHQDHPARSQPCRVEIKDGMLIVWPPEGYTLREFD